MIELFVKNIFRLANGITILACDGNVSVSGLFKKNGLLVADGEDSQEIILIGERLMLNKKKNQNQIAIEIENTLNLTAEEAQSGRWRLIFN